MRKAGGLIALVGALLIATSSFAGWEQATESIDAFGAYLPLILIVVALLGSSWVRFS